MKRRFVYFHICPIGSFEEVIIRIMEKIQRSGLLEEIEELRYVILGDKDNNMENRLQRYGETIITTIFKENVQKAWNTMNLYPKTRCIAIDRDVKLYERATLNRLREDCRHTIPDAHILYIHSKGVSRDVEKNRGVHAWTDAMLDGVITYRHLCWEKLAHHSAVGSFHDYAPPHIHHHFSGNFWWANSSHIASLGNIGNFYLDPEMWIIGRMGIKHVGWVCIRKKETNLYHHPIMSLNTYRGGVVFESNIPKYLSVPNLSRNEISFIDIGLENQWLACTIPPPGLQCPLSIQTLLFSETEDAMAGLYGVKKIVRVHMKSLRVEYFLEGDVVNIL